MAIKGITDELTLSIDGRIKLGIKKISQKGSEYPEEVEGFILNPNEEILDKKGTPIGMKVNKDIQGLIDTLGENPPELTFCFPVDHPNALPDPVMEWYAGSKQKKSAVCRCRGDGEFAVYKGKDHVPGLDAGNYPEGFNRVCNLKTCPQSLNGQCKPTMKLFIVIPAYSNYKVFQVTTHSQQSIKAILSSITVARGAAAHEGLVDDQTGVPTIAWIPFTLYRHRTPNSHGSSNYIMKCTVNKQDFDAELDKLKSGKQSLLKPGLGVVKIDAGQIRAALEEPDYDALPQSEHGRYQTGDESDGALQVLPPVDKETWLENKEVKERFDALATLQGVELTPAKMRATVKKFESEAALVNYLNEKLSAGQAQQPTQ